MKKIYKLTKFNLSKKVNLETGFSHLFSKKIIDDLIDVIKIILKKDSLTIKNFGTFKKLKKKERIGRNPKTKERYLINARESISFKVSKNF